MAASFSKLKFLQMKTAINYLFLVLLSILWNTELKAQPPFTACPGVTAPEMTANTTAIATAPNILTPPPSFDVVAAGLPNIEFFITAKGVMAVDGLGDKVVGTDSDGQINPSDYGLSNNEEFEIIAIGYDLVQIQNLVDSLLNGAGCCSLLELITPGFCDSLNVAGINSGADILSLSEMLELFLILNGDPDISVEGFEGTVRTTINNATIISLLSGGCGGSLLPLCYGIHPGKRAYYRVDNTANISEALSFGQLAVFPNPSQTGVVRIQLDMHRTAEVELRLANQLGEVMMQRNLGILQGEQQLHLETEALSSGVYFLTLSDGQLLQTVKVVVQ